jgi:hypothetical protein
MQTKDNLNAPNPGLTLNIRNSLSTDAKVKNLIIQNIHSLLILVCVSNHSFDFRGHGSNAHFIFDMLQVFSGLVPIPSGLEHSTIIQITSSDITGLCFLILRQFSFVH